MATDTPPEPAGDENARPASAAHGWKDRLRDQRHRLLENRAARLGATLAGGALIVWGMIVFRQPSSTPLNWQALQYTLSQVFHNPASIARGTALILLGMLLLGWSLREFAPRSPAVPGVINEDLGRRSRLLLAGAAAVYLVVVAMILLGSHGFLTLIVFLLALAACVAAVAAIYPAPWRLFSRWELLGLTLAAAAAFGLYVHDSEGWFFAWVGDEWAFFDMAKGVAQGVPLNLFSQAGVYNTHPVMDSAYQGLVMKVLGETAFGWRASCALATVLAVFPLYLLVRTVYSAVAGAVAVGLYLPSHLLMAYAHIGYNEPDALVPLVASIAFFVIARYLRAPLYLFLAGLFAGLGWYTLSTSRVAIGIIVIGLLFYRPSSWADARRDLALIVAGFALALLPFLLVNGTFAFTSLADQSRIGLPGYPPLADRLSQNGVRSLYSFIYSTDVDNHYVTGALFDSVSAFCLLVGMAGLLVWRTVAAPFLLFVFWFLVAINGPTYYTLHLNTTRMHIVVPFACVLAGIGAAALIRQAGTVLPRMSWRRALSVVAVAGIVAAALWQNLDIFYRITPGNMQSTQEALEMEVIQHNPNATIVPAGKFAFEYGYDTAEQAYGATNRIFQIPGSAADEVSAAQRIGKPIVLVSPTPITDKRIRGRHALLFDPANMASIAVVYDASVKGGSGSGQGHTITP